MSEPLDLDAIEARLRNAAGADWWVYTGSAHDGMTRTRGIASMALPSDECVLEDPDMDPADAEFIAHARTDIPALIARVRELEAKNTTLGVQRVRTADALDRVAVYGQRLTEMFPSHTVHAEVGREIARLITTNPLPSEGGPQ